MPPALTPQILYDKLCQIMRVGFVNARQPEKMRVKVTLKDMPGGEFITDWLPVLCPRACGDMQYDLPDIGDQVLCLFLPYGHEQGFVLGAMYGKQTPPVQDGEKWHRTFKDGAYLEYDRASHALKAIVPGTIEGKAAQSINLDAPIIFVRGTLVNTAQDGSPGKAIFSGGMEIQNGGLSVVSGDVVASGVSLASHTTEGVQAGNDTSSHPTGGSAESPGTAAQAIAEYGTAAYSAWLLTNLWNLREQMDEDPTPPTAIDEIIYCLPAICDSMAGKCSKKRNKEGWEYLAAMFRRWLAGKANDDPFKGGVPFEVRWEWLKEFERSKNAIKDLSKKENLFTKNSRDLLIKRLKEINAFRSEKYEFDFINPPIFTEQGVLRAWSQWPELYFQSRQVERQWWPDIAEEASWVDGEQVSMGSFMIYALAKGYTQPKKGGGHIIAVEETALVAYDSFNFAGENHYFFWSCVEKNFSINPDDWSKTYRLLSNSDFKAFRSKYGHGDDFLVISGPETLGIKDEFSYAG